MITEKEFNEICRMYGLVPTNCLFEKGFSFPGFENYVWVKYSPFTNEVECWNKEWRISGIESDSGRLLRPASNRNDAPYSNVEEFRREMDSMVKNFKAMNKKIRVTKLEEL